MRIHILSVKNWNNERKCFSDGAKRFELLIPFILQELIANGILLYMFVNRLIKIIKNSASPDLKRQASQQSRSSIQLIFLRKYPEPTLEFFTCLKIYML